MSGHNPLPTSRELTWAPELAAVAMLEFAVNLLITSLLAEHPQLGYDGERPWWKPPPDSFCVAENITRKAIALLKVLEQYRKTVEKERFATDSPDNDIDF